MAKLRLQYVDSNSTIWRHIVGSVAHIALDI